MKRQRVTYSVAPTTPAALAALAAALGLTYIQGGVTLANSSALLDRIAAVAADPTRRPALVAALTPEEDR